MTALGAGGHYERFRLAGGRASRQCGDRVEHLTAVADQFDAEVLKILGRQRQQHRSVNRVGTESPFVFFKPQLLEPCRDIHPQPSRRMWHFAPGTAPPHSSSISLAKSS